MGSSKPLETAVLAGCAIIMAGGGLGSVAAYAGSDYLTQHFMNLENARAAARFARDGIVIGSTIGGGYFGVKAALGAFGAFAERYKRS